MPISRRKLITNGLAATAGVAGLAAAERVARRYGLIPPDGGGLYGPRRNPHLRRSALAYYPRARPRGFPAA